MFFCAIYILLKRLVIGQHLSNTPSAFPHNTITATRLQSKLTPLKITSSFYHKGRQNTSAIARLGLSALNMPKRKNHR